MYARTYPVVNGAGAERNRETHSGIRPEELLIPQNYHGEMLRSSSSRRRADEEHEPMEESVPQHTEAAADRQVEDSPCPYSSVQAQEDGEQTGFPEKQEKGLLSGLSELLSGHGRSGESRENRENGENPLLLLGLLLFISGSFRDREGSGGGLISFAEDDDLVLLLILFLLLT